MPHKPGNQNRSTGTDLRRLRPRVRSLPGMECDRSNPVEGKVLPIPRRPARWKVRNVSGKCRIAAKEIYSDVLVGNKNFTKCPITLGPSRNSSQCCKVPRLDSTAKNCH